MSDILLWVILSLTIVGTCAFLLWVVAIYCLKSKHDKCYDKGGDAGYNSANSACHDKILQLESIIEAYKSSSGEAIEEAKKIAPIGSEFTYLGNPAVIYNYGMVCINTYNDWVYGVFQLPMVHIQYSINTKKGKEIKTQFLPIDFIHSIK